MLKSALVALVLAACGTSTVVSDTPVCTIDSDCGKDMECNATGQCEPAPGTPGGLGAACGSGDAPCVVGACKTDPAGEDGMRCATLCSTSNAECPANFTCEATGTSGTGVCWPSSGGGCAAGGGGNGLLLALGIAFVSRRRASPRAAAARARRRG